MRNNIFFILMKFCRVKREIKYTIDFKGRFKLGF